jgi:hypothetical protein
MWLFGDQTAGPSAFKVIEENRAGMFRKDYLRLTCRNASTVRLLYGRELGADAMAVLAAPLRLRVTTSGGSFLLGAPFRTAASGTSGPMDVRSVDVPISVLGDAAFIIETVAAAAPAVESGKGTAGGNPTAVATQSAPVSKLTVQNAGPGLGELSRRCGNGPPSTRPAVPTQHI